MAMNDAEAVRVVGSKGVVPREYLRQVVVQGLHTLLHNLAHAAAAAGTGAAVLVGAHWPDEHGSLGLFNKLT